MLYPNGYKPDGGPGRPATLEQIKARTDWAGLDPEFARRVEALIVASDGRLGFGGGWRSPAAQTTLFLSRYHLDPYGAVLFGNRRWSRNPGAASAAPPGSSYHEGTTGHGQALAADLVGDLAVIADVGHLYGLIEFSDVNNEPWHTQPIEIPHARSGYRQATMDPLATWTFPNLNPQQEDDMNTARMIRPRGYLDVFLVGVGPALHLTPEMADSYAADHIPTLVLEPPYPQTIKALLAQSGLTETDLVAGGA